MERSTQYPHLDVYRDVTPEINEAIKTLDFLFDYQKTYFTVKRELRTALFRLTDERFLERIKQENNVTNAPATGGISAPERSGYTFLGWATSEGGSVVYTAADIASVANGTTLYAVWQEQLAQ